MRAACDWRAAQSDLRVPNPGTVAERQVMAAAQPGFLAAYRAGVQAAHAASCADGHGNDTHSAVNHWRRFTILGLKVDCRRVIDPMSAPLERKLSEVDVVEAFAWWLVTHVRTNTETAWSYVGVVNAWHERRYHVGLAGGMALLRVQKMLQGMQRLTGQPILRRKRIGVRPRHLRDGIAAALQPATNPLHANVAALMEVALVALARAGELASGRGSFRRPRHPSRADVRFDWRHGQLVSCTIYFVNSKARGAESLRQLPVHLPARGALLSPGLALWHLTQVVDPVPASQAASTPLFRDPQTGGILTVSYVRETLRACMRAISRDGSAYGAHSLRIGGATAMAWLQAPGEAIQAAGRWRSDVYLRYVRDRRAEAAAYAQSVAGAETDDFEADYVEVDAHGFDAEDEE